MLCTPWDVKGIARVTTSNSNLYAHNEFLCIRIVTEKTDLESPSEVNDPFEKLVKVSSVSSHEDGLRRAAYGAKRWARSLTSG